MKSLFSSRSLPPIWLAFPLLVILLRCSSTSEITSSQTAGLVTADGRAVANEDVDQFRQATQFDKYLSGGLDQAELSQFSESCKEQNSNPFCFTLTHRARLDQPAPSPVRVPARLPRGLAIIPKIKRGKLVNWYDLRYASVSAILRGLSSANDHQVEKVREAALNEKNCPNHASMAVAAHLEDKLPDRISMEELGELYAAASSCPGDTEINQEITLSRSGIFFYAAGNFQRAKTILSKTLDLKDTFRARSLFWLYRVNEKLGDKAGAEEALLKLKTESPFSFHTLVALTSANRDPGEILSRANQDTLTRSERKSNVNPLLEQYDILKTFRFDKSAAKLLDWALKESQDAEPELRLYLAELKEGQGDHLANFSIMSDVLYKNPQLISRKAMEQYFPKHFFPIFEKHSQGLDPLLLLSIARRESAFNVKARSSANARGLLQLTPQTSRTLGNYKDLYDPEVNVFVGARYFSELLTRVNGQVHLALAAYNAGPNRLEQWSSRYPLSDPILFSDLIPFRETREYIAAVLRNYYWYRRIHQTSGTEEITPLTIFQPTAKR